MESEIVKELSKAIPADLAKDFIGEYGEIKKAYIRCDIEALGNHTTKFYETVLQILEHAHTGRHSERTKIDSLMTSLEKSERGRYSESVRIIIPRVCKALITLRSERMEHKSDEVTPKNIDSALTVALCDWIVAEFLRLYHTSDESKIQEMLLEITKKKLPAIEDFEDGGISLNVNRAFASDKILALLYRTQCRLPASEIARRIRVEHLSTVSRALDRLSQDGFIDSIKEGAKITSKGAQRVENLISSSTTTP